LKVNDLILVSLRDFEPDKVDVLHKYTYEEVNLIMQTFEIPECIRNAWHISANNLEAVQYDNNIVFANDSDEETTHTNGRNRDVSLPPMDDSDIDDI
jgi:hypothetical protein